jgi:hypothetical protein
VDEGTRERGRERENKERDDSMKDSVDESQVWKTENRQR